MTFFEARALGMHVRRSSWTDPNQWFIPWRGVWWYFTTQSMLPMQVRRPVWATDYAAAELQATDWTTVPEALTACAVDATIGSTGGGASYATLLGAISASNAGGTGSGLSGTGSYGSGGLPSPGGGGPPTTTQTSDVSVTFSGIVQSSMSMAYTSGVNPNRTVALAKTATSTWEGTFSSGQSTYSGSAQSVIFRAVAIRTGSDPRTAVWSVSLETWTNVDHANTSGLDDAFGTVTPVLRAVAIPNGHSSGTFTSGTCTVN